MMHHKVGLWLGWLLCLGHLLSAQDHPTVFLVGDATAATLPESFAPMAGWGQFLPLFLAEDVPVENRAQPGKSSRSFAEEGYWNQAVADLQPGDYVLIQFAYNDQKRGYRFTSPHTTYTQFLIKYVRDTRARGAIPILVTPVAQRKYDRQPALLPSHGQYPAAMRAVADSLEVPLLDLYQKSFAYLDSLGYEATRPLFMQYFPSETANNAYGITHDTYLSETGARAVAQLLATAVSESGNALKKYLKTCEQIDTLTICAGDSLYLAGAYQTQAGTYREFLGFEETCQRVKTTHLKILPISVRHQTVTLCAGEQQHVSGQWRKESGVYYDTLQNHHGCDSVVITELIVQEPLAPPVVESVTSHSLQCSLPGERYQWFRDGQPLPDTTATLRLNKEGVYAVQVLNHGCVSPLSKEFIYQALPTGVSPVINRANALYAYRRTKGQWTVHLPFPQRSPSVLSVHDPLGRSVARYELSPATRQVDLDCFLVRGVYTVSWIESGRRLSVIILEQ